MNKKSFCNRSITPKIVRQWASKIKMKTIKQRLNDNSNICFIYGFADIQDEAEIQDWQKEIEEKKETHRKAIIIVVRQTSKGYHKLSESADLCLMLKEEKYISETKRKQFIQILDNYLVKPFTGNGIWDIKSMSKDDTYFNFTTKTISLVEFENSTFDIVRQTIGKMIQTINQPKDVLFLIVFSDESYKSAEQICEIVNELDKKGNSYLSFGASNKNYLEISLFGTNFK